MEPTRYDYSYVNAKMLAWTKQETQYDCFFAEKLGYHIYNGAIYIPFENSLSNGTLFTSEGEPIIEAGTFTPNKQNFVKTSFLKPIHLEHYEKPAVLLGNVPFFYGHAITDGLKSIWISNLMNKFPSDSRFVIFSSKSEIPHYFKVILSALKIKLEQIDIISKSVEFSQIVVPQLSFFYLDGILRYSIEYKDTISRITNYVLDNYDGDKTIFNNIYFSRMRFSSPSREIGEYVVESEFKKKGYKIIYPETLSFEHQIWLLHHCKIFATTEGTISHNAAFCRTGSSVVIFRKTNVINTYQLVINQLAGLFVTYVDAHHSKFIPNRWKALEGPFYICVTPEMERFFGHSISHLPYFFCFYYWWYSFRQTKFAMRYISNRNFVHYIESLIRNFYLTN